MNLADAIRKAAQEGSIPTIGELPQAFQPKLMEPDPARSETRQAEPTASVSFGNPPETPNAAVLSGNCVRIELFMTAEQTAGLLRAVMTGQHSVLTIAEAAHYLRVRPQALAKMAEENEIPAVEIDGKWRFLKSNLDEWLAMTVGQPEAEEDNQNVA